MVLEENSEERHSFNNHVPWMYAPQFVTMCPTDISVWTSNINLLALKEKSEDQSHYNASFGDHEHQYKISGNRSNFGWDILVSTKGVDQPTAAVGMATALHPYSQLGWGGVVRLKSRNRTQRHGLVKQNKVLFTRY